MILTSQDINEEIYLLSDENTESKRRLLKDEAKEVMLKHNCDQHYFARLGIYYYLDNIKVSIVINRHA